MATAVAGRTSARSAVPRRADLKMERNFARDPLVFRSPSHRGTEVKAGACGSRLDHSNMLMEKAYAWTWKDDTRQFLVPYELLRILPKTHVVRDVLAAITTMYYTAKPHDRTVCTTLSEIAKAAGMPPNAQNLALVQDALAFLRGFTILNQEVITRVTRTGRKADAARVTWGFVSYVMTESLRDGREVKPNKRRTLVCLSEPYARLLDSLSPAILPLWWLKAAKRLPRRLVVPGKNLIYRLAAEKKNPARWRFETLVQICDLRSARPSERREALENLLRGLTGAGVLERWDHDPRTDVYALHPANATQ